MSTYLAPIQLGQRQHQSARYRGFHSKKLRSHQDGLMEKHLHNFMIGQFKRTFQILYLDEICCFLYVYVYMLLFIQETYMVLITHKTILIRFLHLFSQIPIYRRGLETN